jgi:hypothetical protein
MAEEKVASLVWDSATTHGHRGLEIEFRIGHVLSSGRFSSDVGKDAWERLRQSLDASEAWTRPPEDIETVEELVDGGGGKLVSTIGASAAPYWLMKTVAGKLDFQPSDASSPFVGRASVARESVRPVEKPPPPMRFRRHKVRRRYVWNCWAFDLTRVRSTLPDQLDADVESFEVEIELIDTGMLFERTISSLVDWGFALVDDMVLLMMTAVK